MAKRGQGGPGKLRPHVWRSGPNEYKHSMYVPWMLSRAQANFRQEAWTLTFEEYFELWQDLWPKRGRKSEEYCMTRQDCELGWTKENSLIILRKDHLAEQARLRTGKKYPRKPKV